MNIDLRLRVNVESPAVPAVKLWRVKADQYTRKWGYKVRPSAPAPAVFRTGVQTDNEAFRRATFSKAWQFFAADLLALQKFGLLYASLSLTPRKEIQRAFSGLYAGNRAFTNGKGVDTCNNYIVGEMFSEDPKIDPLICAGNRMTGDTVGSMVRLDSFRASEPPPVARLDDPRVCWATIISATGVLSNFPQLGGMPVPYPYIAVEPYYYPAEELEVVA